MSTADCTHCGGFAMVYPAIYTKSAKYTGTMAMFGFLSPWFKYKCMVAAVVSDIGVLEYVIGSLYYMCLSFIRFVYVAVYL
jgi:hypothetical protein